MNQIEKNQHWNLTADNQSLWLQSQVVPEQHLEWQNFQSGVAAVYN
jgi:hypothetical protein